MELKRTSHIPMQTRVFTTSLLSAVAFVLCIAGVSPVLADGWRDNTKALNIITDEFSDDGLRIGGIANSRHNLTMSYSAFQGLMTPVRNNYYEICVYCHTPHGANSTAAAPLWNRTVRQGSYTLYGAGGRAPTALGLPVTQPGPNSLTCLSCHDGATAIDSIINMPTQLNGAYRDAESIQLGFNRAGYNVRQETAASTNEAFLDQWSDPNVNQLLQDGVLDESHARSSDDVRHAGLSSTGCLVCHNPTESNSGTPPNFNIFVIGGQFVKNLNDGTLALNHDPQNTASSGGNSQYIVSAANFLADDHPVGVRYPSEFGAGVDYAEPNVKLPKIAFFDINGDGHADPNEVRLYDTGDGYEVECGSCHDPHGVPINYNKLGAPGDNSALIPSFLRVGGVTGPETVGNRGISGNRASDLCLTCHIK